MIWKPLVTASNKQYIFISSGFKYFGVQYGKQCFCGNEGYDKYGQVAANRCNVNCPGDSKLSCGGTWVSDVYSVEGNQFLVW